MEDQLLNECFMNCRLFDSHFHLINHKIHKSKFKEYNFSNLINDYNLSEINVTLRGGICVEMLSACYQGLDNENYNNFLNAEISWLSNEIKDKNDFYFIAPISFESVFLETNLHRLINIHKCLGVRQILNHNPSWPRNKYLGNLLKNDIWVKGFNLFCESSINCDLQINPNQFLDTYDLIKNIKNINFIINHMGLPLYKDMNGSEYWTGLKLFSELNNVFIKLSRISYVHENWDNENDVQNFILKVINLFGTERVLYGSNQPIESNFNFDLKRSIQAFISFFEKKLSPDVIDNYFFKNCFKAYRIS
tara:strand:- start:380 stop:1297 length:918 start_codon:yes stop_codon:yes gene_type:complete